MKNGSIAGDIQQELEKLLWADLLVLNFPIFWFSAPAIFKGWIERVLVTVTLDGLEHMFGEGAIHGPLEDMLRPILRGTLAYVGYDVLAPFVAWHVPYISDKARKGFLEDYRVRLERLSDDLPLEFPRLGQFDEALYPMK